MTTAIRLGYEYVPDGVPTYPETLQKLDILRLPKKEVETLDHRIKTAQKQAEQSKNDDAEKICQEILENLLTDGK